MGKYLSCDCGNTAIKKRHMRKSAQAKFILCVIVVQSVCDLNVLILFMSVLQNIVQIFRKKQSELSLVM